MSYQRFPTPVLRVCAELQTLKATIDKQVRGELATLKTDGSQDWW